MNRNPFVLSWWERRALHHLASRLERIAPEDRLAGHSLDAVNIILFADQDARR